MRKNSICGQPSRKIGNNQEVLYAQRFRTGDSFIASDIFLASLRLQLSIRERSYVAITIVYDEIFCDKIYHLFGSHKQR